MSRTLLNQSTIIGSILILFGAGALLASFDIPLDPDGQLGARTFPVLAAGVIFILGVIEMISGITQDSIDPKESDRKILIQVLLLLGLSLFYVWIMAKIGYLISTAITAPLVLMLFGVRNRIALVIAAILCPVTYHLLFFVGLGVFPPYGEWFDLLDLLEQ